MRSAKAFWDHTALYKIWREYGVNLTQNIGLSDHQILFPSSTYITLLED